MRRTILAVIFILFAVFCVYGQNSNPVDLVLVLDTSAGMSSSYENVNNYITGSFLSEFLRVGDTFHLISFSNSARLDVARRISGIGDVETIIGRMLLQYPVERGSNPSSALSYTERYIASLPARPKKIVFVSLAGSDTSNLVSAARQRFGANTTIDFIQVIPGQAISNLPVSGRSADSRQVPGISSVTAQPSTTATQQPSSTAAAGQPSGTAQTTPATRPTTTTTQTQPAATSPQPSTTTQPAAQQPSTTATQPAATTAPDTSTTQSGTTTQPSSGTAATDSRTGAAASEGSPAAQETTSPSSTTQERSREAANESLVSSMPLIIGAAILALLVLGLIIFGASRRLGSSPNRVMAQVASSSSKRPVEPVKDDAPFADHSKDLAKYAAGQNRQRVTPYSDRPAKPDISKPAVINPSGPLLLNLFVEDQNTAIGKRNIHSLKSGYSLSVGGGNSDFWIFLVPIPPNIGEIRRNGSQCTFIPHKPKFFPDLGSGELKDCINKTIRVVSDKNYEMRFRFEMYEDPLIALNRVLMSVKVPG